MTTGLSLGGGLSLGTGLYKDTPGLWSGASGLVAGFGGYNPASALFGAGESGYWLDPSDFSTMFQDAAGTTPVTATGQSVRLIVDKSQGLSLGSQLVTIPNISGVAIGGPATTSYSTGASVVAGRLYEISFTVSNYAGIGDLGFTSSTFAAARASANGNYKFRLIATNSTSADVFTRSTNTADFSNISIRQVAGNHFTQANTANAPLLQVDSTGRHFLLFDGSDDWLQSAATINPGAVDKAQVFAGVRKLADIDGIILESSPSSFANAGTVSLIAASFSSANYFFRSRGSVDNTLITPNIFPSHITNVVTGLGDISAPSAILRVNGAQAASNTASQGTGNYLTYQHFIGRRGGTGAAFNGRLYQLITRYGPNFAADQITQTETFVNARTGAF